MRIGVMSDTHNHLANVARIVELLNHAGIERVVHTGDITQPKTLEVLARLRAPLHAVLGNNDLGERTALERAAARLEITLTEPPLRLDWAQRRILVLHDPREIDGDWFAAHDVVLHGHTHRHALERRDRGLLFNPGECAGHLSGRNAVGVVDLASLEVELLRF